MQQSSANWSSGNNEQMSWIVQNLWLIPALPLLAAAVLSVTPQPHRRFAATVTVGTMGISFLLAVWAFARTLSHGGADAAGRDVYNFSWFQFGNATLRLGWVLDPLTAIMLVMVTFVGL